MPSLSKRMKTLNLVAAVDLHELTNVPCFEPTTAYAVMGLTNAHAKHTTGAFPITNNKATFPSNRPVKFTFKTQMDKSSGIQAKYLHITFFTKLQSGERGKPTKLGDITINLIEFVKSDSDEVRFLLENSKSNAIAKLFISVKANDGLDDFSTPSSSHLKSFNSTLESSIHQKLSSQTNPSTSLSYNLPMMSVKSPLTIDGSLMGHQGGGGSSMKSSLHDTHSLMVKALDESIDDHDSNELLNKLFNKTYRFTWQLQDHGYDEFTPSECIRDIVERNGNGWKKNDEGFDMIDIVQTEYWDKLNNTKRNLKSTQADTGVLDEDDDEWADFDFDDPLKELDEDEEETVSDDEEYYDLYNPTTAGHLGAKKSFNHRVKPLSEIQVRDDLRSWNINV